MPPDNTAYIINKERTFNGNPRRSYTSQYEGATQTGAGLSAGFRRKVLQNIVSIAADNELSRRFRMEGSRLECGGQHGHRLNIWGDSI